MNKRIKHSYKLKDDTLESLCEQLINSRMSSARLRYQLEELQQQLQQQIARVQDSLNQADKEVAENERKVIYFMQTKHKKKCVVNRISFELVDNDLKVSLVLD